MPDHTEWITVHDTAVTNTNPDSNVNVSLDPTPICQNMSNADFRALIVRLRDAALPMIQDRIVALSRWDQAERERAKTWFGRADDQIRATLVTGLPKLAQAMKELKPEHVVRWDEQKSVNITCTIFPDNGASDAAVCKPDSARRYIAIYPHFCTLPDAELWSACKLKTIIHECTHYIDTFNSDDVMYGQGTGLQYWAINNGASAIRNADSIAAYIVHFDKKLW